MYFTAFKKIVRKATGKSVTSGGQPEIITFTDRFKDLQFIKIDDKNQDNIIYDFRSGRIYAIIASQDETLTEDHLMPLYENDIWKYLDEETALLWFPQNEDTLCRKNKGLLDSITYFEILSLGLKTDTLAQKLNVKDRILTNVLDKLLQLGGM